MVNITLNLNMFCVSISGAFLIPFMTMLILEGIPLFLIELGMGQKMRLGSLGVWNTSNFNVIYSILCFFEYFEFFAVHPWLGGIGISSCIVTLFVALYYNVIITWCFFYLVNSFRVGRINDLITINKLISWKLMYSISSSYLGHRVLRMTTEPFTLNVNRQRHTFGIEKLSI